MASADQSLIQLSTVQSASLADGRSMVDITAIVSDNSGHRVPSGTIVAFTTTLGTFQNGTVTTTTGGIAHAILIAPDTAGVATISATAVSTGGSPSVLTYEFVGSRAELSAARDYVEILAPSYMQYAHGSRMIGAAAPHQGVSLRYKDVQIRADDLQYDINAYTVKARKAHLKIGHLDKDFDELNITLNTREGYGTTTYVKTDPDAIAWQARWPIFLAQQPDGSYKIAQPQDHYGLVHFRGEQLTPFTGLLPAQQFQFTDLSDAPSTVSAHRAVVYPRKEIQFQGAEIYVASTKIVHLPLFVVNFGSSTTPMVTDGLLSVNDSQIGINYPQYLILRPGITSDLRFHMGDQYGRGYGSDRGAFLDYELHWDRGDDMEGGMTLGGIGRQDWEFDAHQFWRFDPKTTATAQFQLPAGQGFYGSGDVSHQFSGFALDANASHSQTFTGFISSSQSYALNLGTDPRKVGDLPFHYTVGLTATETSTDDQVLGARQQAGEGLTARAMSNNIPLDKTSILTSSITLNKLYGANELRGFGVLGVVNISHHISRDANVLMTYNYTQDGLNDAELGRHMISLQGNYHRGKLDFNVLGSKGLGVDRLSLYADARYRLGDLWHLSYSYTSNRILGTEFLDYNIGLSYRLGWRDVGVIWSEHTHRFGLQLLGATF